MPRADAPPVRVPVLIGLVVLVAVLAVTTFVLLARAGLGAEEELDAALAAAPAEVDRAAPPTDELRALLARMETLVGRLDALETRLVDADARRRSTPRRAAGSPGVDPDDQAGREDRVLRALETLQVGRPTEPLDRTAPVDEARLRELAAAGAEDPAQAARELLLMTAPEVIAELGTPTKVFAGALAGDADLGWQWRTSAGDATVWVWFHAGYVGRVQTDLQ